VKRILFGSIITFELTKENKKIIPCRNVLHRKQESSYLVQTLYFFNTVVSMFTKTPY